MKLCTQNLVLRTVSYDDTAEVARMWRFEKGEISPEQAKSAIDEMNSNHSRNRPGAFYHLCFAVFEQKGRKIIGWCGLDGTKRELGIQIFYMIDRAYRKKGYATQCAKALIEYGFGSLGIERIDGGCAADNEASKKVMLNAGMKPAESNEVQSFSFRIKKNEYRPWFEKEMR